jgi:peptidoglycan/LPS O-acetylase OafA/YrhL
LASTWRPGAVAWGVAALYLLIAVETTSLARRMLPRRIWRATHFLSFPLFVISTVHLLQSGTDAVKRPVQVAVALLCVTVAMGTWARIRTERRRAAVRATRTMTSTAPISPAGHEVMSPRTNPADRFGLPANNRVVDRPEPARLT